MNRIIDPILSNKALIAPLSAWCVAQMLKVLILLIRDRRLNLSYLVRMGGMPSAHAALVCALATTIAIMNGVSSAIFAIAAFWCLTRNYLTSFILFSIQSFLFITVKTLNLGETIVIARGFKLYPDPVQLFTVLLKACISA